MGVRREAAGGATDVLVYATAADTPAGGESAIDPTRAQKRLLTFKRSM